MVELRIIASPASKGSKTAYGQEMFRAKIKAWEKATVEALWVYKSNLRLRGITPPKLPLSGPISVSVGFLHQRPKSHLDKFGRAKPGTPRYFTGVPDVDKLTRCCLDALTKAGVIEDDRLVCVVRASKKYCQLGELPGAEIQVHEAVPVV